MVPDRLHFSDSGYRHARSHEGRELRSNSIILLEPDWMGCTNLKAASGRGCVKTP